MLPFLVACAPPTEMNAQTAKAFQVCMDKDWVPDYYSNGSQIHFECEPQVEPIPMNDKTHQAHDACLAQEKNAVYNGKDGSFYCVDHGARLSIR